MKIKNSNSGGTFNKFSMKKFILIFIYNILFINLNVFSQQNTILIIADDVSPDYFGFYKLSHDTANTPNIRKLAERGIVFTKAWASPVCSPTRAGIFTGRYSFRTGVGAVITNGNSPQLDTSEWSLPKILKSNFYRTANVGKWHLHNQIASKRKYPNIMGYDFYSGNFNGAIPDYYEYVRIKNGILDTVRTYATTQTIDDAIGWLDSSNSQNPFFLWVAFNAPHSPYHLPPSHLITNTGLTGTVNDIKNNPKKYFKASIEALDTEIGRLLKYIDDHQLTNQTNIILIGDNGNDRNVAQITDTTKAKGTIYDYGVHVPMIYAGPLNKKVNYFDTSLIQTIDIFATVLELSGISNWRNLIPDSVKVDSKSFKSILEQTNQLYRSWIFSEQFNTPSNVSDGKTIRNHHYHLLRFDNGQEKFYKISDDVEEDKDLLLSTLSIDDKIQYQLLCDTLSTLLGNMSCSQNSTINIINDHYIEIFPNPSSDKFIIKSNILYDHFYLYNIQGELLIKSTEPEFSISHLSAGLYIVQLKNENNHSMHKVMIYK